MWYIFNSDKKAIATCDFKPNQDDLATRNEIAVESQEIIPLSEAYLENGLILKKREAIIGG